ncbi:MAG: 2-amino-4-oxopentanoate thiolase subunit OrtA [Actinobacteria bacterium]|nr:2-amino-4-oxopentanoate thiolase subunit OrtA [Actinomycetota bacterium]
MVKKGQWVQIHRIILTPEDRAPQVPDDTKSVPYEMRTKGFLLDDAQIGDEVEILSFTGRVLKGKLLTVNPPYSHDFGSPVEELLAAGKELRDMLERASSNEAF